MARSDLDALVEAAHLNPMAVQRAGIEYLKRVTNGEVEVVDPSNAFVYLLEFASTLFTNGRRKAEFLNRVQYPEQAMTRSDLYRHMSDVDYINVFGSPSVTKLLLCPSKSEIMEKAVDTGVGGVRKLVIPRHTEIRAGDVPFTLQYPIEIRVLAHGGLQIVYDNERPSPLMPLETNQVDWTIENYNIGNEEFIQMEVPVQQVAIKSYTAALTAAKVFSKTYPIANQYHYCRVYASAGNGQWTEIKTTHSDQIFDPATPTAVLKLTEDGLNVSIPQVYYSTNLVSKSIRVDIYTTLGVLELALNGYGADMFSATFADYDNDDNGKYTAPASRITAMYMMASKPATGGSNAISFDKLKERAIHNALGPIEVPITNVQIQTQLDQLTDSGFSCVLVIDNTTRRLYSASRELPAPSIKEVSTGAGANVVTLSNSIAQILAEADVKDNGLRITVLPTTLYKDNGGYLSIVDAETRDTMLAMSSDVLVEQVTNGNYFYTPFHYVYDTTDGVFTVRPYYFGSPEISNRFFVTDNGTMGVGVTSNSHSLQRTDTGWVLQIMTNSTDTLKDLDDDALVAQLAYIPPGEISRVYLNGELVGRDPKSKEWIFEFRFDSTWDVDATHLVYLDGFEGEGISPHPYPAALSTVFDIFYGVETAQVDVGERTSIDDNMGKFLFTPALAGLYHEQITVKLGEALEGLWARARSTAGEEQYMRYDEDVYKRYTTNVPAKNPETGAVMVDYDGDGKPYVVYEHMAGDIELDEETEHPVVLHQAGTVVLQNGEPIVMSPRSVLRQVEFCLVDGAYYFVTNETDVAYRETVPQQIVEWVNITLAPIRKKLLENTTLWFHPKATVGLIKAIVDGSLALTIQAAQHLEVEYFVDANVYRNEALKDEIRKSTRKTITAAFKALQVSRDGLQNALKDVMGDDVMSVSVSNLGGPSNYSVITMADESSRLCIGKKLVALPNATFGVEDSIDIVFSKHTS
ncbi:hypothetical protein D9M68_19490 [compost metagenome]